MEKEREPIILSPEAGKSEAKKTSEERGRAFKEKTEGAEGEGKKSAREEQERSEEGQQKEKVADIESSFGRKKEREAELRKETERAEKEEEREEEKKEESEFTIGRPPKTLEEIIIQIPFKEVEQEQEEKKKAGEFIKKIEEKLGKITLDEKNWTTLSGERQFPVKGRGIFSFRGLGSLTYYEVIGLLAQGLSLDQIREIKFPLLPGVPTPVWSTIKEGWQREGLWGAIKGFFTFKKITIPGHGNITEASFDEFVKAGQEKCWEAFRALGKKTLEERMREKKEEERVFKKIEEREEREEREKKKALEEFRKRIRYLRNINLLINIFKNPEDREGKFWIRKKEGEKVEKDIKKIRRIKLPDGKEIEIPRKNGAPDYASVIEELEEIKRKVSGEIIDIAGTISGRNLRREAREIKEEERKEWLVDEINRIYRENISLLEEERKKKIA